MSISLFHPKDTVKSGLVYEISKFATGRTVTYSIYWSELKGHKSYTVLNGGGEPLGTFDDLDYAEHFVDIAFATAA